jgi:hypothetical protein
MSGIDPKRSLAGGSTMMESLSPVAAEVPSIFVREVLSVVVLYLVHKSASVVIGVQ